MKGEDVKPQIEEILKIEDDEVLSKVQRIHSALTFKDERYLFLIDENDIYVYDSQTQSVIVHKGKLLEFIKLLDYNIVGIFLSDEKYLYTL